MPEYISAVDIAEKWGISKRRVTLLCKTGRIPGVSLIGNSWIIPVNAEKPPDIRIKSGKYRGAKRSQKAKTTSEEKAADTNE